MNTTNEKTTLCDKITNGMVSRALILLLVGGTLPWWWQDLKELFYDDEAQIRTEYIAESAARVERLLSRVELTEISSKFFVADKIGITENFLNELPVLDDYVNPKFIDHKFESIIDELIKLSDDEEKDVWSSISEIIEQLKSDGEKLKNSLIGYRDTSNPQGGDYFLDQSDQHLQKILNLLENLKSAFENATDI